LKRTDGSFPGTNTLFSLISCHLWRGQVPIPAAARLPVNHLRHSLEPGWLPQAFVDAPRSAELMWLLVPN